LLKVDEFLKELGDGRFKTSSSEMLTLFKRKYQTESNRQTKPKSEVELNGLTNASISNSTFLENEFKN